MELKINDLRLLLSQLVITDFNQFYSDTELNEFHEFYNGSGRPKDSASYFKDCVLFNASIAFNQDYIYDKLDLYIKLLTELAKHRPLPF